MRIDQNGAFAADIPRVTIPSTAGKRVGDYLSWKGNHLGWSGHIVELSRHNGPMAADRRNPANIDVSSFDAYEFDCFIDKRPVFDCPHEAWIDGVEHTAGGAEAAFYNHFTLAAPRMGTSGEPYWNTGGGVFGCAVNIRMFRDSGSTDHWLGMISVVSGVWHRAASLEIHGHTPMGVGPAGTDPCYLVSTLVGIRAT